MPLLTADLVISSDISDLVDGPYARHPKTYRPAPHPAHEAAQALAAEGEHVHVVVDGGVHCAGTRCAAGHVHVHQVDTAILRCAAGC
ncbi:MULTISPECIES: hypothetical protein [unclassified Streptomyces]|uniref:hypothetical protein n=1 Tax=unclassified Streptomyces TaxID=2593676 RepID=UPI0022702DA1|nr:MULTISPECIES: hypothetical protein [unclassified Streptomyces]MCY0921867.1 hypothetical protein [Streptomyces sp. H27-G5]MCY0957183.1 hypothetical protein [Streptomyces sp. H27-H5]